jgi:transcriptional regulator GlxA family with amidase domain
LWGRVAHVNIAISVTDFAMPAIVPPARKPRIGSAEPVQDEAPGLHVRLLWLPHAMPGMLLTALDVLRTADGIARLQRPGEHSGLSWQLIGPSGRTLTLPMPGVGDAPRRRRGGARSVEPRSLLLIPGVLTRNAPHLGELIEREPAVLKLMERHREADGWIAASFNGIGYVAQLGLLDGARVGAPWMFQSWMARRFPRCDFTSDEQMGLHQRVFICVAPALQTEFMLRVLGHLHDPDLAQAASRVLLPQPERQQLMPDLTAQRWLGPTSDSPVYRARRWLQTHVGTPYRLADVARAAAVSERTLLRHFRQVTGVTPLDYLHTLRVERAKTMLEVTLHGTQAIAEACGYSDAAAFRRLFLRATGLSMSDYRARFALRASRRYWRVEGDSRMGDEGEADADAGRDDARRADVRRQPSRSRR